MGEELTLFPLEFNRSVRIEARPERLTSEVGALAVREVLERSGIIDWLAERVDDPRDPEAVTHPTEEILRTEIMLPAQGWRDHGDADACRGDPTFRLAVSERRGDKPLRPRPEHEKGSNNPTHPDGLASQPTLSRASDWLATRDNRVVLREALCEQAAWRLLQSNRGHRQRYLTIDVDSLPIDVHGQQKGSEFNGHYGRRIFHPIVATAAELGDLLDVQLRPGSVHTAEGDLDFILPLLDRVEEKLCQVAAVRIDAGYPDEELLSALEARQTPYVSRVRNNKVLDRMAAPYLKRPVGRRPAEPRTWTYELCYRAETWSRSRRVVLVVMERPDDLYLHHFWLITNWSSDQVSGDELLEHYRQRGTAEGHLGELMNVIAPALSATTRHKSHYRGEDPVTRRPLGDSFNRNEVRLLLAAAAYNVMHALRVLMENTTREGWSLLRLRERVLRTASRVLLHGRRVTFVINEGAARWWRGLLVQLAKLKPAPT